tara:strand:+ start:564 stop:806 length:243 start_codon:yes stop_codon:yes gene_type:complete
MIVDYKFQATLKVDKDPEMVMKSIKPDFMHTKRSSVIAEKKEKHVLFHVKAADLIALKAAFLSLIKMLQVKDKINKVIEN